MHVVVGALLVRGDRVLLAHRSPAKRWYPDVWDLVGGHVDPGETHLDCAPEEHDDLRWFTLAETDPLPLAHPSLRPLLHRLLGPALRPAP